MLSRLAYSHLRRKCPIAAAIQRAPLTLLLQYAPDTVLLTSSSSSRAPSAGGGSLRFLATHPSDRRRKKKEDPYKMLGISQEVTYAQAKKKFLKIAMENHPDTSKAQDEAAQDKMREIFIASRRAFEKLVEAPDGSILLKEEAEQMPDFDSWFHQETGHKNPFDIDLDPQTIKEVTEMTEDMGEGLNRDGGMWQLAKMVSQNAAAGGDAASMLRLEAGAVDTSKRNINGVLRRRRK